jgi:hypothetical protein
MMREVQESCGDPNFSKVCIYIDIYIYMLTYKCDQFYRFLFFVNPILLVFIITVTNYVYMYIHMYTYIYLYVYMCIFVYIEYNYVHIHIYIYICIYIDM